MKSKDFIAMLQEADPSGEGHVRLPGGGAVWFAEVKEGYWDGSYAYMKDGKYHTTTQGYKIDIHVHKPFDMVWDYNGDMNVLREKFSFDYGNSVRSAEKEAEFWRWLEKQAAEAAEYHEDSLKEWIGEVKKIIEQYDIDEFKHFRDPYAFRAYSNGIELERTFMMGEIKAIRDPRVTRITENTDDVVVYSTDR